LAYFVDTTKVECGGRRDPADAFTYLNLVADFTSGIHFTPRHSGGHLHHLHIKTRIPTERSHDSTTSLSTAQRDTTQHNTLQHKRRKARQHNTVSNMATKKSNRHQARTSKKKEKSKSKRLRNKASSTTDTSTETPTILPTPTGFLALPPELRNAIYRYALVSNEPIKAQFGNVVTDWSRKRYCFLMLPRLAKVSKQVRRESQRIFFEENQFEIAIQLWKHPTLAPLNTLNNMHRQLGLEISTLRVDLEIEKLYNGVVYLFIGHFTLSNPGPQFSVSDEAYDAIYFGGRSPVVQAGIIQVQAGIPHVRVCGCRINSLVHEHRMFGGRDGIVQFLRNLTPGSNRRGGSGRAIEEGVAC
jgi:hypothetical protein